MKDETGQDIEFTLGKLSALFNSGDVDWQFEPPTRCVRESIHATLLSLTVWGGMLPAYEGSMYQDVNGLSDVLRSVFRTIFPIITSGATTFLSEQPKDCVKGKVLVKQRMEQSDQQLKTWWVR